MRYVNTAKFTLSSYISKPVNETIEISLYQNFSSEVQHRLGPSSIF
jgi:hypothetical protein